MQSVSNVHGVPFGAGVGIAPFRTTTTALRTTASSSRPPVGLARMTPLKTT
jgi:hypothetical protein